LFTEPLPEAIMLRRQGQRDMFEQEESQCDRHAS
jgi:hypothetical protein